MKYTNIVLLFVAMATADTVFAGCAGCGADYNRKDRAQSRYPQYEPGLKSDPIGNAIVGGAANSALGVVGSGVSTASKMAAKAAKAAANAAYKHYNSDSNPTVLDDAFYENEPGDEKPNVNATRNASGINLDIPASTETPPPTYDNNGSLILH